MSTIKTQTATLHREGDLIIITSHQFAREEARHAHVNAQAIKDLAQDDAVKVLLDMRKLQALSREARHIYTNPQNIPQLSALAIVIGSPMSKIVGNLYVLLSNKGNLPTKIFNSTELAHTWLIDQAIAPIKIH